MSDKNNKTMAEAVFARLAAQLTNPFSLSLVKQQAKAVYAETLLTVQGTSEDVFARLEAAAV